MERRPILILIGPTAVGKSRLAMEVAERLKTEIISADSRQVYRGMDIGTAKPTPEDRARVRHHLIDLVAPDGHFDAGDFRSQASAIIDRLHGDGKVPIVVGGTGLYIRTLSDGLCDAPKADPQVRSDLLRMERERGEGYLFEWLQRVDPVTAQKVHPRDSIRLIRALEVVTLTGRPLSSLFEEGRRAPIAWNSVLIGLTLDRTVLYQRIEGRVDEMIRSGLENEVRQLVASGYDEGLPSMSGLGYKQWFGYFRGDYGRPEVAALLKRDTRRYAKRQMTWFRRDARIRWVDVDTEGAIARLADEISGMFDPMGISH